MERLPPHMKTTYEHAYASLKKLSLTTTMYDAVCVGDVESLSKLVNETNVNEPDEEGRVLIQYAVWHERIECVKFLIEKGVNVNVLTDFESLIGKSFLRLLSYTLPVDILRLLLDAGMKPHPQMLLQTYNEQSSPCARLLLDRGVRYHDPTGTRTPFWVYGFSTKRKCLRTSVVTFIAIATCKITPLAIGQDVNVFKFIGKHIWSLRLEE